MIYVTRQKNLDTKWADAIINESRRIARIVKSLLSYARPRDEKQESCMVKNILDEMLLLLQKQFDKNCFELKNGQAYVISLNTLDIRPRTKTLLNATLTTAELATHVPLLMEPNCKFYLSDVDIKTGLPTKTYDLGDKCPANKTLATRKDSLSRLTVDSDLHIDSRYQSLQSSTNGGRIMCVLKDFDIGDIE